MLKKLSNYIKLTPGFIGMTLYGQDRSVYYKRIEILKRNGKIRVLHAVMGRLKTLQQKTYERLKEDFKPSTFAKGFVKGGGIIEHARIHRNKKIILSFDIKDFFPNITFARVYGMLKSNPFNFPEKMALYITQICCLDDNGPIPQGAVTSPYISNMICRKLDSRLSKLAIKEKMNYSRYADDITLSSNKFIDIEKIKKWIDEVIQDEGFELNHEKTRVLKKHQRQIVTGIVVNNGLNVNRKYINNTRALIHNCLREGVLKNLIKSKGFKDDRNTCSPIFKDHNGNFISYRSGPVHIKEAKKRFFLHILGRIQHIRHVAESNKDLDQKNYNTRFNIAKKLTESLEKLRDREKQEGIIKSKIKSEFRRIQDQDKINAAMNYSKDQLDELIKNEAFTDPRYFIKSFSGDIEVKRAEIIKYLEYPAINQMKINSFLEKLRDSRGSTLGKIVHFTSVTLKEFKELFEDYNINTKPYLNKELKIQFNNVFDKMNNESFKNQENKIFDFNEEKNQSLNEQINTLKQSTRFGKNPEDSSHLSKRLFEIEDKLHEQFRKREKYINFNYDMEAISFRTDTNSVIAAMEHILKSMYTHSPSKENSQIIISSFYNKNDVEIHISNNNEEKCEEEPRRDVLSHGKIRNAMFSLNGLCDYYIRANFKNHGWREINMFCGKSHCKTKSMKGYTHVMRFKSCI